MTRVIETDEELAERRRNFDQYKKDAEKKHREHKTHLQDTIEELESLRRSLMQYRQERGKLEAEAKVRQRSRLRWCQSRSLTVHLRNMSTMSKRGTKKYIELQNDFICMVLRFRLTVGNSSSSSGNN